MAADRLRQWVLRNEDEIVSVAFLGCCTLLFVAGFVSGMASSRGEAAAAAAVAALEIRSLEAELAAEHERAKETAERMRLLIEDNRMYFEMHQSCVELLRRSEGGHDDR